MTCPQNSNDVITISPDGGAPFAVRCFDSANVPVAVSGLDGAGSGWVLVLSVSAAESAAGTFGGVDASANSDVWISAPAFGEPTVVADPIESARSAAYARHPAREVLMIFNYGNDRRAIRMPFAGEASLLARLTGVGELASLPPTTWRAFSPVFSHVFGASASFRDGVRPTGIVLGANSGIANGAGAIELAGLGLKACGSRAITAGAWRANVLLASCDVQQAPASAVIFVR